MTIVDHPRTVFDSHEQDLNKYVSSNNLYHKLYVMCESYHLVSWLQNIAGTLIATTFYSKKCVYFKQRRSY